MVDDTLVNVEYCGAVHRLFQGGGKSMVLSCNWVCSICCSHFTCGVVRFVWSQQ